MKCWYELDIDISKAIKETWKLPNSSKVDSSYGIWYLQPRDIFNDAWLEYMTDKSITITEVMLFYRGPYRTNAAAHIDLKSFKEPTEVYPFALNWVIGGKGSSMVWYKQPSDKIDIKLTAAKTKYADWKISELKEVDRHTITNNITLVNVGVPHNIIMGSQDRWCISARSNMLNNIEEWHSVVEYLKNKEVLINRP